MNRVGQCRLCLSDGVELRDSHFFPAAAYKIMRNDTIRNGRSLNTNPIRFTDEFAVQTSEQYTARLLCENCEQRFHSNGEDWVLKHCWRGRTFRLVSLIGRAVPKLQSPEASLYYAAGIPGVNISALAYFAASMFWRASVQNWAKPNLEPAVDLGPYRDQLRRYLIGSADFPKDCMLVVVLPPQNGKLVKFMMHPFPNRVMGCSVYTLLFLGIQFGFYVGRKIPQTWRELDLLRGSGNPITVDARFDAMFLRDLCLLFGKSKRALSMLDQIEDKYDPSLRDIPLAELLPVLRAALKPVKKKPGHSAPPI